MIAEPRASVRQIGRAQCLICNGRGHFTGTCRRWRGRRYEALVVLGGAPMKISAGGKQQSAVWVRCVCGNRKQVVKRLLIDGRAKSCGCQHYTNNRGMFQKGHRGKQDEMLSQAMSNTATIQWAGRELKVWVETVTPERAEKVLASNEDKNRNLRKSRVARYAADMRKDKWRLTGEPVRLDENGMLLNGQHRMYAVLQSGCAIPMMFVSGISSTTMLVQDTGLPKTDGDWSPLSVQALRMVKVILRMFGGGWANTMSVDEQIEAHGLIGGDHVQWALDNSLSVGITNKAPVRAALALLHKINPARAAIFATRLKDHAFPAKSPESALDASLSQYGASKHQKAEAGNAMRAIVAAARDPNKPCAHLKGLAENERQWVIKAASLERLRTIRRPELTEDIQGHGAAVM